MVSIGGKGGGADAADLRCLKRCFVLQTPMNSGSKFVLHSLWNMKPVQRGMQQIGQTAVVLASTSDDTSGGIQCSLKFVGNGLGCPNEQTI